MSNVNLSGLELLIKLTRQMASFDGQDVNIGICSYDGGPILDIVSVNVEKVDDGHSRDMIVLYTETGSKLYPA